MPLLVLFDGQPLAFGCPGGKSSLRSFFGTALGKAAGISLRIEPAVLMDGPVALFGREPGQIVVWVEADVAPARAIR